MTPLITAFSWTPKAFSLPFEDSVPSFVSRNVLTLLRVIEPSQLDVSRVNALGVPVVLSTPYVPIPIAAGEAV